MLGLITKPVSFGLSVAGSVAGAVVGAVRSRLLGDDPRTHHEPATREPASREPVAPEPDAGGGDGEAPVPPGGTDPDDLVLLDRVKSEIFRPGDAEKGSVNVSVENGVVILRGDVDDPAQSEYFEVAAAEVEGVIRVENLIASARNSD